MHDIIVSHLASASGAAREQVAEGARVDPAVGGRPHHRVRLPGARLAAVAASAYRYMVPFGFDREGCRRRAGWNMELGYGGGSVVY